MANRKGGATNEVKRPEWFKCPGHLEGFVNSMPDEVAVKVFRGMFSYLNTHEMPDFDPMTRLAFAQFQEAIDNAYSEVQTKSDRGRANIQKRWNRDAIQPLTSCKDLLPVVSPCKDLLQHDTEIEYRIKNIENKENNIICDAEASKKTQTVKRFTPPTPEEVNAFCADHGYSIDANRFVDYYTAKGWICGKTKMKDWHAAIRLWVSNQQNNQPQIKKQENVSDEQRKQQELYEQAPRLG